MLATQHKHEFLWINNLRQCVSCQLPYADYNPYYVDPKLPVNAVALIDPVFGYLAFRVDRGDFA